MIKQGNNHCVNYPPCKEVKMKHILLVAFFVIVTGVLFSQVPVEIENMAEDYNGKMLVTKFRDLIRGSTAYEIDYGSKNPHFVVQISTIDKFKGEVQWENHTTIYNYTIMMKTEAGYRIYCFSMLGYVGKNRLDETAYQIYSDLDSYVENFKYYFEDN